MSNALPILSEIARSVLAFLASSAKSERGFLKRWEHRHCEKDEIEPKEGREDCDNPGEQEEGQGVHEEDHL